MKSVLICPTVCSSVPLLARRLPLVMQPYFGRTLLDYWLEHLACAGVSHVTVLAADHLDLVRALVRNGERWGLKAEVWREPRHRTAALVRAEFRSQDEPDADWLPEPEDVAVLDHFPGRPGAPLFQSYPGWFKALQDFLPRAAGPHRIGVREIKPGIWAALRARVSPLAQLRAPCWIGERAQIGPRCIIGPEAIIEDGALVDSDCEIAFSVVGPQTFVGKWTEVRHSLAWGDGLLNWRNGSFVSVPDPFLLCALGPSTPNINPPVLTQLTNFWARTKAELQAHWRQLVTHKGG